MSGVIEFHEDVVCAVYRPYLDDHRRYNVFYGGASSGKSYFIAQRNVLRVIGELGHNYLVVRKVDKTNRVSTFALTKQIIYAWNLGHLFRINQSDMSITCTSNGNQMIFKGLDDREKLKSITFERGILTDIWIEEATEPSLEDFKQLQLRLRGKSAVPKQITLSFNPISALHWAKEFFFDVPLAPDQCTILKTTYLDNEFLEDADREAIEDLKNQDLTYYKIYGLGEWGVIGNIVFHNYVVEDFAYTADDLENVCHGMDFGFVHASTLMSVGFRERDIYIFDEQYFKKHTNPEFIARVDGSDFGKRERITADSAEPDRIKEWNKAGYRVRAAKKGPGTLRMGIDWLKSRRMHIHATRCPYTAREIPMYKHREDKDGNPTEDYVELFDDCIAGIRYATESLWSRSKAKVGTISAGKLGL